MTESEPSLERLMRRLAETPPSLLAAPRTKDAPDGVHVAAVVRDVLERTGPVTQLPEVRALLAKLASPPASEERALRLTLVAAWLLDDAVFANEAERAQRVTAFLTEAVPLLASAADPALFVTDAERREELVRRALAAFGARPAGESEATAEDRLAALDSGGRSGFLRDAWARLKRAREIREAMRKKEAEEAAARWGGE
jgi:hypothetical protein